MGSPLNRDPIPPPALSVQTDKVKTSVVMMKKGSVGATLDCAKITFDLITFAVGMQFLKIS